MNCRLKYIFLLWIFILATANAQNDKLDKIIKKDYTIIEGIITKISEKTLEYNLPDERLVNVLELKNIARIEFANGKSRTFDAVATENTNEQKNKIEWQTIRPNTVAILPIPFVNSRNHTGSEEMAKFAQGDVYSRLARDAQRIPLEIQDIRDTNDLLRRAGIDYRNIDEIPIGDLHKILGVDNIIASKVSYTTSSVETTDHFGDSRTRNTRRGTYTDNYSTQTKEEETKYQYLVYLDIYKNTAKIYTRTRQPLLSTKNSWTDAMVYLFRRSPIYSK